MNKKNLLIIAVSVLVLALIGLTYLLFSEKQTNRELVQEFQLDKEDLENEYTRFAQQYDELKLTVSNDSLADLLAQEQVKTQRLLEEAPYGKEQQCHRDKTPEKRIGNTKKSNDRLHQSD